MAKLFLGTKESSPVVKTTVVKNKEKFGLTFDNFLGNIDENGVLQRKTTFKGDIVFDGVVGLSVAACENMFLEWDDVSALVFPSLEYIRGESACSDIANSASFSSVSFPSLKTIEGTYVMRRAFYNCLSLNEVLFPKLEIISGTWACQSMLLYTISSYSKIKKIDFANLTTITGTNCMENAFNCCGSLQDVLVPKLTTISGNYACTRMFHGCKALTTISFPSLITIEGTKPMYEMFTYCTNLSEIHFRSDMQVTVEALSEYSNKFGATNATIYFDL